MMVTPSVSARSMFRKVNSASDNKKFKSRESVKDMVSLSGVKVMRTPNKISSIQIPEDIGIIKDSYRGVGDKLVVHIQDAHCNYEAQTNIYKIIQNLVENNNLKILGVEGSEGLIDVTPFSSFPDTKIKEEVADFFMKKGRITGPEYYAITSGKDVELFGIEDKNKYNDNLDAFKKTMPYRPRFEAVVAKLRHIFEQLKPKILNRELIVMDSKLKSYEDEDLSFSKYCDFLIQKAKEKGLDLKNYTNMRDFSTVSHLEDKVDFEKVDEERNSLIEGIRKRLSKRYFHELVLKTTHYKNGKITAGKYHDYIVKLARGRKVDMDNYKNLKNYTEYMLAYEGIDHDELLREKEIVEEDVKETMFENIAQKMLSDMDKVLKKIDGFYQLEMSRDDLAYYKKNKEFFAFAKFLSFIGTYAPRYGIPFDLPSNIVELDQYYVDFLNYYGHAKDRDVILNAKTLSRMEELDENIIVQVCGGFHTDGMMRELKDKKISYIVLAPRITKSDDNNPYLDILLGRTQPFDDLFNDEEAKAAEKAEVA
jgi:hypothetical protein